MTVPLPSKDMVVRACFGAVTIDHPVLRAAQELARLHGTRGRADSNTIDRERARLLCRIDAWVAAMKPPVLDSAYLHSETVGMIIDRLARLSVEVRAADHRRSAQSRGSGHARDRLAELADAYGDLAFEISRGIRRLPAYAHRVSPDCGDL